MSTIEHPDSGEVTQLLLAVREGREGAFDVLFAQVYDELRRMAGLQLRRHQAQDTVHATALVHELYLKLEAHARLDWQSRAHFFGIAARAMRQILVNLAHERNAQKRGGGWQRTTLGEGPQALEVGTDDVLGLDQAIRQLSERQQRIVEYRFFGGMHEHEIAEVLGVSTRTVEREWVRARAWLYRALYAGQA